MTEDGVDARDPGTDDALDPAKRDEPGADDAEGQALTWKVRKPIPEAAEDTEGQGIPPSSEQAGFTARGVGEEEDDTRAHGGSSGGPLPRVD
jgi:hypothetical protein